jgi:hypothetical protein
MAFIYYAKVDKNESGHTLRVFDLDNNKDMWVQGQQLIEHSFSADQFDHEEKVTKMRAAEILVHAYNRPLTVCFVKQDGEERILRGRLIKPEPLLGRSSVEDLDIIGKNRVRLVDHRTLKWIIVDGTKHVVKSK